MGFLSLAYPLLACMLCVVFSIAMIINLVGVSRCENPGSGNVERDAAA